MVLRDTLLRVAAAGCFRAHWSGRIIEEVVRNLVDEHRMEAAKAELLVATMRLAFPDAEVDGWQALEAKMPNHPKDRHVAAAAAAITATTIVTSNLKDFKILPAGVVAMGPDAFLLSMLNADPEGVLTALTKQAAGYRHPPATLFSLVDWLSRVVPEFARGITNTLGVA